MKAQKTTQRFAATTNGARILAWLLAAAMAPSSAILGEAVYLNCGGPDVTDARGRTWKNDEAFLAADHSPTETAAYAGTVDRSLLTDPDVPNEVLSSERSSEGDLRYSIPVSNGCHRVTLYFSENCASCVAPELGGTGCPECARIFRIEVESAPAFGHNPADAAVPPEDDGFGSTFVATELSFVVSVKDEMVDIRIGGLGSGSAAGYAAIEAIAIRAHDRFRRGDANGDGQTNIADAISVLGYLFAGRESDAGQRVAACLDAADANDDGAVNIADAIKVLSHLFGSAGPLPAPFPGCGVDETDDDLPACSYQGCPCEPAEDLSRVPCGAERTIYRNSTDAALTVTIEAADRCQGLDSILRCNGVEHSIEDGGSAIGTFVVPPGKTIVLECRGTGDGDCPYRMILPLVEEETIAILDTGDAFIERSVTTSAPFLADLYRGFQAACETDSEARDALDADTQAYYLSLLGAAAVDIETGVAPANDSFGMTQTADLQGAGTFDETGERWQVMVGPTDDETFGIALKRTLNAMLFASIYLESLPGEQAFHSTRTTRFVLPDRAPVLNEEELDGRAWSVDLGGGTFVRSRVTVEGGQVVLVEETMVAEGPPAMLLEDEGAAVLSAFQNYRTFSIDYAAPPPPALPKRDDRGPAGRGYKDGGCTTNMLQGYLNCYWDWYPSHSFERTFSGSSWRVKTKVDLSMLLGAKLGWDFDWRWWPPKIYLDWFETWIRANPYVRATLDAQATISLHNQWSVLVTNQLRRDFYFYWGIPIWIAVVAEPYASAKVGLDANLNVWYQAVVDSRNRLGARWDDGWSFIDEHALYTSFDNLTITWGVNARMCVGSWYDEFRQPGLDLTAYLYGVAGPYVRGNPYLDGRLAVYPQHGEYTIRGGFAAWGGVKLAGWLKDLLGLGSIWDHKFYHWETIIKQGSWNIDTTPPTITVAGAPSGWSPVDATASVTCSDPGGSGCDPATYRLKIYDSNPGTCPCTYSAYDRPSPQTISSHVWVCGAGKDKAGNLGCSSPVEFKVDKLPPQNPAQVSSTSHTPGTWSNDNTVDMAWSGATDPGGSGIAGYSIAWDQSGGTIPDGTPETNQGQTTSPPLADGGWWFHVRTVDNAGNAANGAVHAGPFPIDRTPPGVPVLLSPPDGSLLADRTPLFDWTDVSDPSGVTYTLRVWRGIIPEKGAKAAPHLEKRGLVDSFYELTTSEALPDDTYSWSVVAVDGAGNSSPASTRWTFRIDTAPPPAPLLVDPLDGRAMNDTTPLFDWTDVSDPSGVTYTLRIWRGIIPEKGAKAAPHLEKRGLVDSFYELTTSEALPDDTYSWSVVAVDGAGNSSPASTRWTFRIDTAPPPAPLLVDPLDGRAMNDTTPLFDWTDVSDPSGVSYTLRIWRGIIPEKGAKAAPYLEKTGLRDSSYELSKFEALPDGAYSWSAIAVDGAGNSSPVPARWTFAIDTAPPVIALTGPAGGARREVGQMCPITWTAGDGMGIEHIDLLVVADLGMISIILVSETLPGDQTSYVWTPEEAYDRCDIRVTAFDRAGNMATDETWVSTCWLMSTDPLATAFNSGAKLARDAAGGVHAVFSSDDIVYYALSADEGARWSRKIALGAGRHPAIALDAHGEPFVVCAVGPNPISPLAPGIYFAQRDDGPGGIGWRPPVKILELEQPSQPSFDVDGAGGGHVIAVEGGARVVYGTFSLKSPSIAVPEEIDRGACGRASLAVERDAAIPHACWDRDGEIYYSVKIQGDWLPPTMISEPPGPARSPHLCLSDEAVHVVWEETGEIFHVAKTSTGWGTPENISTTGGLSTQPQIAPGPAVVWQEEPETGDGAEIYGARWSEGTGWSGPRTVSASPARSAYPHIAIKDDSAMYCLWTEAVTSDNAFAAYEVRFRLYVFPEDPLPLD